MSKLEKFLLAILVLAFIVPLSVFVYFLFHKPVYQNKNLLKNVSSSVLNINQNKVIENPNKEKIEVLIRKIKEKNVLLLRDIKK